MDEGSSAYYGTAVQILITVMCIVLLVLSGWFSYHAQLVGQVAPTIFWCTVLILTFPRVIR